MNFKHLKVGDKVKVRRKSWNGRSDISEKVVKKVGREYLYLGEVGERTWGMASAARFTRETGRGEHGAQIVTDEFLLYEKRVEEILKKWRELLRFHDAPRTDEFEIDALEKAYAILDAGRKKR